MSKNSLGRELPEQVGSYCVRPYEGAYQPLPEAKPVVPRRTAGHRVPGGNKLVPTLEDAILASGLKDGMTISFHHSFREGDKVIGQVLTAIRALGIKGLCLVLGAMGIANMWAAIFADVGVMVIAVLNAIRALQVKNL